jgi:hypothetical protein
VTEQPIKIIRVPALDQRTSGMQTVPVSPPVEVAAGDRVLFVLDSRTEAKP